MAEFTRYIKSVKKQKLSQTSYSSKYWIISSVLIALLVSVPIISVLINVFVPAGEIWSHLAGTVLDDYIINSLILMVGVGTGTIIIGVSTAWIVTMCNFPGRKIFEWALLLPLALPAYLLAYILTDFLDVSGYLQNTIRDVFAISYGDYWFPEIRSRGGAILVMSLAFYPYVYLLSRASFLEQSTSLLEAGKSLGASSLTSFFRIALPLARPGIIAGLSLVLMETLNDFGTVQYFGVQTFTTGIYRTWFGLGERIAASQLAAFLMGFIVIAILLERWSRSKKNIGQESTSRYKKINRFSLSPLLKMLSILTCALPIVLGFILPVTLITLMFLNNLDSALGARFFTFAFNTISVALITGFLAIALGLLMAYAKRLSPSPVVSVSNRVASSGYAIPGSVIAVGVLIPFGLFDNALDGWMQETLGISTGLLLSGTMFAMIFAYLVRFMAVSFSTIEASLGKITQNMDEAARGMGYRFSSILKKIHIPMMSGSLLTALLLVVVDVMKELPATLIVRPFNFDTLAVQVYRLASDERLAESSGAALAIIIAGIVPVLILSRTISKSRKSEDG